MIRKSRKEKEEIFERIKKTLLKNKEVVFAFVFGSFLENLGFRDIDIGIYLKKKVKKGQAFDLELNLAQEIAKATSLPFDFFDVKVLNFAPNHFLNNVFSRGKLLFSRDDKILTDLIEKSSLGAIANYCLARESLKELVPK